MSGGKHYNQGNVWGRVTKAEDGHTRDKKTPFLDLEINCSNHDFGPVRAFGRLWGKEKIQAFKSALKGHEKDFFRFKGYYGQYSDGENNIRYSSYFFYDFERLDSSPKGGPRAAFILVGELDQKELVDGEGRIVLEVIRSTKERETDERFELVLFDLEAYYEIEVGDLIEVRGNVRKREGEDLYGGSTQDSISVYAMQVKKRKREE